MVDPRLVVPPEVVPDILPHQPARRTEKVRVLRREEVEEIEWRFAEDELEEALVLEGVEVEDDLEGDGVHSEGGELRSEERGVLGFE